MQTIYYPVQTPLEGDKNRETRGWEWENEYTNYQMKYISTALILRSCSQKMLQTMRGRCISLIEIEELW